MQMNVSLSREVGISIMVSIHYLFANKIGYLNIIHKTLTVEYKIKRHSPNLGQCYNARERKNLES